MSLYSETEKTLVTANVFGKTRRTLAVVLGVPPADKVFKGSEEICWIERGEDYYGIPHYEKRSRTRNACIVLERTDFYEAQKLKETLNDRES